MCRNSIIMLLGMLCGPVVLAAEPEPTGAPLVIEEFGVTVIHGHVAEPAIVTTDAVEVLPPVYPPDYDRYAALRATAELRREAIEHAVPPAPSRRMRPVTPWTYTPTDQTYTPKTDWTYHPRVGKYTPQPTRWYTPKREWTHTPRQYRSWY